MKLIDADKLIEGYKHMGYNPAEYPEDSYGEGWCIGFNNAVSHCISHVIYAPTVEKRITGRAVYQAGYAEGYKSAQSEHKTGKWIQDAKSKRHRCDQCFSFALKTDDGKENLSDFCPVCGSAMEGE